MTISTLSCASVSNICQLKVTCDPAASIQKLLAGQSLNTACVLPAIAGSVKGVVNKQILN